LARIAADDDSVVMVIGPSQAAEPLEVGVKIDEGGITVIHAMPARAAPQRLVIAVTVDDAAAVAALERWAEQTSPAELQAPGPLAAHPRSGS
jgi:hypothetical protein